MSSSNTLNVNAQNARLEIDYRRRQAMTVLSLHCLLLILVLVKFVTVDSFSAPHPPKVALIGGGISGLTVAHVLQQSGHYQVEIIEAQSVLGGHIRSLTNPNNATEQLNIGHATHMGMFVNLRLMLKHFGIKEWPVGRGPNDKPGLFRMISVTGTTGQTFQPTLHDIMSPLIWWEAFRFYFGSYLNPDERLGAFLAKNNFSKRFLDILYWAMATFEFDKHKEEADEYAVGAARALLITQVFFQFLLCDAFEGSLPSRVDRGLKDDLASRILRLHTMSIKEKEDLVASFEQITSGSPLASYFTSSYGHLVEKLATSAGRVRTNAAVKQITKKDGRMCIEISNGDSIEADHVVFTTHPSVAGQVLNPEDFPRHTAAIHSIKSGAVGVRIIHANDLPYSYPPISNASYYAMDSPSPILGIFDISELTTTSETSQPRERKTIERREAGWMSVAYPVYEESSLNRHQKLLDSIPCADATVYPWTRATSSFPNARRHVVKLQGVDGIYMTGQSLTGVNKASELQVTNALNLCHDCFGVLPPWGRYFPCVMLTDCNDADAFYKAKSPLEASLLALKSLVGSFLLTSAVSILGVEFFD